MPCKTKPRQSSRESPRMVHAMPLDTPRPPKFLLKSSYGFRPNGVQKTAKTTEKLENMCLFLKNCFFHNFKWYLGGLGVSGSMAWTIRGDSLELWRGLVLHGMGEVDFHVFLKKLTSSPNTSKLVLGPPCWSSDFFAPSQPNKTH